MIKPTPPSRIGRPRSRVIVICQNPNCGKEFEEFPSEIARGGGNYCSRECRYHTTPEQRFWQNVVKLGDNDCWLWTGIVGRGGYGRFKINCKVVSAHRYSWELHRGEIDKSKSDFHGICVLHKCDTPACVNPNHLFLGSIQDNIIDRDNKGRTAKWEGSHFSKLTLGKIKEIRSMYGYNGKGGLSLPKLASKFGVSISTIHHIVTNKTWKGIHEAV